MNHETYREEFEYFVKNKLTPFYEGLKPFYAARGATDDSLSYFRNHYPRFQAMIDICIKNGVRDMSDMCELGSWYPFTTYFFKLLNPLGTKIDLYDIITKIEPNLKPYDVDGVKLHEINFNREKLPDKQYDLIILSEVMEHLPINLFRFEQEVINIMKDDGYLVVSYPMIGTNAKDYDKDLEGYDLDGLGEPHLREFTTDTVTLFFRDLKLIDQCDVNYPAYGHIRIMLYKKVKE